MPDSSDFVRAVMHSDNLHRVVLKSNAVVMRKGSDRVLCLRRVKVAGERGSHQERSKRARDRSGYNAKKFMRPSLRRVFLLMVLVMLMLHPVIHHPQHLRPACP